MCAPSPPDPKETAAAQTGTNVSTALANTYLGNMNQITPEGSLTYTTAKTPDDIREVNIGPLNFSQNFGGEEITRTVTDPTTGTTYEIPQFTATTTLSPENQEIFDRNKEAQGNLAIAAAERSGFLRDYLPNASPEAIDAKLYELGSQRLDPRFEAEENALRTRLANQGIAPGSEAFEREMRVLGQNRNDAYNQLVLNGRATALSEINNPINQITALLSGSQVASPNFPVNQPSRMPNVDYAGLVQNNYKQHDLVGGLFGLGSAGITAGWFQ